MDSFWDYFWLMLTFFFMVAYLIVLFNVVIDLFRDRDTSGLVKVVWLIFLLILTPLTVLVYVVVRGKGMAERSMALHAQAKADTDSYIRDVAGATPAAEISSAKALLDSGTITAEEFHVLKAKALQ